MRVTSIPSSSVFSELYMKVAYTGEKVKPKDIFQVSKSRYELRFVSDCELDILCGLIDPQKLFVEILYFLPNPAVVSNKGVDLYIGTQHIVYVDDKSLGQTAVVSIPKRIPEVTPKVPPIPPKPKMPQIKAGARTAIIVATPDIMGENFRRCLDHIWRYTDLEYQLIVVETHFKEKPYNHARDMNIVFKGCNVDYYVLLNDDVFVLEGWLETLIETAMQDPKIGVVGALLLYPDGERIQHAGVHFDEKDGWDYVEHTWHGQLLKDTPQALEQRDCITVTGALNLITKRCVEEVGYWDEKLPLNWNEVDYNLRVWQRGLRVVYTPKCKAIHRSGVTIFKEGSVGVAYETSLPHRRKKWPLEKIKELNEVALGKKQHGVHSFERVIPEEAPKSLYMEHMARYHSTVPFIMRNLHEETDYGVVLDNCGGVGYGTDFMSKFAKEVVCLDKDRDALDYGLARYNRENTHFVRADCRFLPFKEGAFDVCVGYEAIEHLRENDQESFVGENARVLKKPGKFLCSTPMAELWAGLNPYHLKELTTKEFGILLKKHFTRVYVFRQSEFAYVMAICEKV